MGDRAGLWLRVSTSGQDEENQRPRTMDWCRDHEYEVAREYRLHGFSASKGRQQAKLDEVLDDMRRGVINVLVCFSDSRIERRGIFHMVPFIGEVLTLGCRIEFVTQPHLNDLTTMGGRMSLVASAEVSREEGERRAAAVAAGMDAARASGAATTKPPFGIITEGSKREKRFVPDEDGRRWIPEIFANVAGGASLNTVAYWLQTQGAGGRARWHGPTVAAMIRNTAYAGYVTDASGAIVHRFEPLVDMELWQRANKALSDSSRKRRGPVAKAMLAKALACGTCGSAMYRVHAERGEASASYRCSGGCGLVNALRIENAVERIAQAHFNRLVFTTVLIPGHDHSTEIAATEFELSRLGLAGLDEDEEDRRRAELRAERKRLRDLPTVADEWREEVDPDHQTYGQWWQDTPREERGRWLTENGFHVTATKTGVTMYGPWNDEPMTEIF